MPRGYQLTCQRKLLRLLAGQMGRLGGGLPGAEWKDLVASLLECRAEWTASKETSRPTSSTLKARSTNRRGVNQPCSLVTQLRST